ncbi:hypothetical protein BJY01DRAFT_213790 [Aspergillus pseudoustus]|uniref:Azaphilone pigments biosynthesis cluster protein L N-terminal domain-containing protein n=1 Tax=Aspergillus pseudoustus TaxID=1810923 RepID=A0ABR4K1J0_9EURO
MAEALGAASAITTFVTLAFQATVVLYQTVKSIGSRERIIRELREELHDLTEVLQTLNELAGYTDIDLTALEGPLERCAGACKDFNVLVVECTQHSSEERYSKRDWLKIQYMGEDISGFKNMLAGYKSTITIALAYVNLRTTKITKDVIEEYKDLIQNTQCDLETHLEDIHLKMETLSLSTSTIARIDPAELRRMEDEKQSTQKSLDICQQFLLLVDQSWSNLLGDLENASREPSRRISSSERPMQSTLINAEGLNSARKEIMSWKLQLLQNLYQFDKQLPMTRPDSPPLSEGLSFEKQNFQEEVQGTEALLEFCKHASAELNQPRMNYYEDVTAGDNSHLAVVTTLKDLISAKRIKSGNGSKLVLGQMSDDTLKSVLVNPTTPNVNTNNSSRT